MWRGWSRALSPRLRERGGRTPLQEDRNWCKLITISVYTVCPSYMTFRLTTKDLGRFREMPSFALSRRQHGFEPRWGHKIKVPLTRSDTKIRRPASPWLYCQGRARDARASPLPPPAPHTPTFPHRHRRVLGGLVLLAEFGLISAKLPGRSSNVASRRSTLSRPRARTSQESGERRACAIHLKDAGRSQSSQSRALPGPVTA
jgi:hypothetical protein